MPVTARRPLRLHASRTTTIAIAILSAIFLFTAVAMSRPTTVFGWTSVTKSALCDDVSLRTKPSTSATRKVRVDKGTLVTAVGTVSGGSWRSTCTGRTITGSKWVKISKVSGKSVSSLYGVSYVYAKASHFKTAAVAKMTACDGVALRTKPTTSATRKTLLKSGVVVSTVATVSGGSWKATCAGRSVSGSSWYRIKLVSSKNVSTLYGVTYLYAATGLFKNPTTTTAPAPTPTPTPTPTPKPTPTPTPKPSPTPTVPTLTEGIDVSHWQGTIDWAKVKAAGKKFAYIKASENTSFVDNKYATNRSQAKANGILVGAYHFAQPGTGANDAVNEAEHFINTAKPVKGELIPVLDLEITNGLGTTALVNWTKSFLQRVYDKTGVRAAIYVSPSFWSSKLGNTNWFANNGYKVLWVAHWTTGSTPTVPAGNWGTEGWTFWQYTSSGTVSGISGRVDLNRYKGSDFTRVLIP